MNTPTPPGAVGSSRAHPAIIVAAIAVTGLAIAGIAALMGWLPGAHSGPATPASFASPAQQVSGGAASEYSVPQIPEAPSAALQPPKAAEAVPAPALAAPASRPQPATPNYGDGKQAQVAMNARGEPSPVPAQPPARKACANCGTVTSVSPIEQQGEASGLGAVVGGVVGGVVGHQVGQGRGKDVATVAGALGGAYAGNQIEKSQKRVVSWEVRVKLENGTSKVMRYGTEPAFRVGDKVKVEGASLVRG